MPDLLTVQEVAAHLRVSDRTIRRWIEDGNLSAFRPGRKRGSRIRIRREEAERFAGPLPRETKSDAVARGRT